LSAPRAKGEVQRTPERLPLEDKLTEPDQKRSYPYLGTSAWADLRRKLRSSIPKKIDKDYLHTALGISDKAAANMMPQLKALGLIEDDGSPTELVHDLRDDDKYAEACRAMIARIYPSGLVDAVPDPNTEIDAAIRWFMRQGAGETTARNHARFYAMLASGELPESTDKPKKAPKPPPPPKSANKTQKTHAAASVEDEKAKSGAGQQVSNGERELPTVHIDLQVHISPDSSPEQIDAIFASMAKHLYGR
jgi:hypothetical protein